MNKKNEFECSRKVVILNNIQAGTEAKLWNPSSLFQTTAGQLAVTTTEIG